MARTGRPLKFTSVEDLEAKISAYFESCFEEKWFDEDERDENGNIVLVNDGKGVPRAKVKHIKKRVQVEPVSITGLAYALDTSRQTLLEYQENSVFVDTIKKAKNFVERCIDNGLLSGKINPAAGIFNLKNNWDWKDKTELEHSGEINNPYDKLTDEEIRQKLIDRGRQEDVKDKSDIPNGGSVELPKDGPDTQGGGGVS